MKKVLVCCSVILAVLLCSCRQSGDDIANRVEPAKQEDQGESANQIDSISDISSYSYIGEGNLIGDGSRGVSSNNKKMIGIRKDTQKASVIHFLDSKGQVMKSDPSITASLSCDSFTFYKLSFTSSDYYGEDFASAAGDLYCVSNKNGKIYKIDGAKSMNTGFGEFDCYNDTFIGSFTFENGDTLLCKVYVDKNLLKVEKKVKISDFPEFKHVFMDAKGNIFAYDWNSSKNMSHFNWVFNTRYVISNRDKIYMIPQLGFFLGFNRVVYSSVNRRLLDGVPDPYNPVKTLKEKLSDWFWNETKGVLECLDRYTSYVESIRPDGKKQYIRQDNGDILVEYYNDLDLADLPTSEFIPPELTFDGWNSAHQGPYMNWGYSKLLYQKGNTYCYITKSSYSYEDPSSKRNYINKITFTNDEHTKYTMVDAGSYCGSEWGDEILDGYEYESGKIFFIKENLMRTVDIEQETKTVYSNPDIVKYHSVEKVNNNDVALVGTNTAAEKMYYKIDSKTMNISLIGSEPTFGSVSFHPIGVSF